jgi:hypothetical protein
VRAPTTGDHRLERATGALDQLWARLRRTTLDDDPGYLALAAVAAGVQRALLALDPQPSEPSSA